MIGWDQFVRETRHAACVQVVTLLHKSLAGEMHIFRVVRGCMMLGVISSVETRKHLLTAICSFILVCAVQSSELFLLDAL
jgi:hypothetical protein